MNYGNYRASDKTFCTRRHWIPVYRIAAVGGFTIDGDYCYFKHIVYGTNLSDCKAPLIERSIKGVYRASNVYWSEDGLVEKNLNEYNDIKQCTEVFLKTCQEIV